MGNNLLNGGITYPNSSFIFDRVYDNYNSLNINDDVYVGRYVLVKYCDIALSQDDRILIETWAKGGQQPDQYNDLSEEEQTSWVAYKKNFTNDNYISYDRKVFRKIFKNNEYTYEEIASLNSTLSDNGIKIIGVADQENSTILSLKDKILSTTLNLIYDEKGGNIQLTGKDDKVIAEISTADFIVNSVFTKVTYDDDTNIMFFHYKEYNYITGEYEEKTISVDLYSIIDPYVSGNGINVESIPDENPVISINLAEGTEDFLTVDENGLKLSGIKSFVNEQDNILNTKIEEYDSATRDYVDEEINKTIEWNSF